MVSRDVGFRPAVPLPTVAILLRVLLNERACLYLTRLERVAALWKPLSLSIAERNSANGLRIVCSRLVAQGYGFDALPNGDVQPLAGGIP